MTIRTYEKLDSSSTHPRYLYRYYDRCSFESGELYKFEVLTETSCGYWINSSRWPGTKQWVPKDTHGYAQTAKEALISYKERKKKHVQILENKLRQATRLYRWSVKKCEELENAP